jgi:hypothetical protein
MNNPCFSRVAHSAQTLTPSIPTCTTSPCEAPRPPQKTRFKLGSYVSTPISGPGTNQNRCHNSSRLLQHSAGPGRVNIATEGAPSRC